MRHPFLVRDLAERFRLDERYLAAELARIGNRPAPSAPPASASKAPTQEDATPRIVAALLPPERELMRVALMRSDGMAALLNTYHVTESTFWSASGQRIFRRILIAEEERGDVTQHILNDDELTPDERRELADILFMSSAPSDRWQRFNVEVPSYDEKRPIRDALLAIEIHRVHERIDSLTRLIESTVDLDEKKRHIFRLTSLIRQREELRKRFEDAPSDLSWLNADSAS